MEAVIQNAVDISSLDIDALKTRIAHMQQELSEISHVLDQWASSGHTDTATPPHQPRDPLANMRWVDKVPLRRTLDELFERLGIEKKQPMGAENLQQMLLERGVKPEDKLFSRGIIEMREE